MKIVLIWIKFFTPFESFLKFLIEHPYWIFKGVLTKALPPRLSEIKTYNGKDFQETLDPLPHPSRISQ